MREIAGKVAVVTGAASGIGRAIAERMAREGARVVLADVEQAALDTAVTELRDLNFDVTGVRTDVLRPESIQSLAQQTLDRYGKIHLVFNNAGVEGYLDGALWEATDKDWTWTFGVNFWGVVHGVRTFLPIMLDQGEDGHMVNTASATALVRGSNMYGVTKHAVRAMTETLYGQLKQRNARVGVSVLCPGVVNTRLFAGERNRPPELQEAGLASAVDAPRPSAAMRQNWFERAARSNSPATVADIVLDGIREDRFYIYTDHEWDDRIQAFTEDILTGRNPQVDLPR